MNKIYNATRQNSKITTERLTRKLSKMEFGSTKHEHSVLWIDSGWESGEQFLFWKEKSLLEFRNLEIWWFLKNISKFDFYCDQKLQNSSDFTNFDFLYQS